MIDLAYLFISLSLSVIICTHEKPIYSNREEETFVFVSNGGAHSYACKPHFFPPQD